MDSDLSEIDGHPLYTSAMIWVEALQEIFPDLHIHVRPIESDGSIAMEIYGEDWNFLASQEVIPEESGWCFVSFARESEVPTLAIGDFASIIDAKELVYSNTTRISTLNN